MDLTGGYNRYKKRYIRLKRQALSFYIIHATRSLSAIERIVKEGTLRRGSELPEDSREFGAGQSMPYVFGQMYFTDLRNLERFIDNTLILDGSITDNYTLYFNKGWHGYMDADYVLYKGESMSQKVEELLKIREFLKNPDSIPEKIREFGGHLVHEVLFEENLYIKPYLRGILCYGCNEGQLLNLKDLLEANDYGMWEIDFKTKLVKLKGSLDDFTFSNQDKE